MGGAIGQRLAETGQQLTVFDPDPAKIAALEAFGARRAASAAEAASVSDFVILSLNSPKIVRLAVFGEKAWPLVPPPHADYRHVIHRP